MTPTSCSIQSSDKDQQQQQVHTDAAAAKTPPSSPSASSKPNKGGGSIVKLNVGGFKFTTSRATLCRFPGTFLESLFSGRHSNPTEPDPDDPASYFIDRDGTHFRHILNFLRVGYVVSLPDGETARNELAAEADFYGLDDLVKGISAPQVDVARHLSEETLRFRREEVELRKAFVTSGSGGSTNRSRGNGNGLHDGLVPLFRSDYFDADVGDLPLRYTKKMEDRKDELLMASLRKKCDDGTPVTVKGTADFRSNFNRQHPNVLNRIGDVLRDEPVIIAGGSVLRALTKGKGIRTSDWWGGNSDIDIFLHSVGPEEATRIARRIFYALAVDNERWVVVRSGGVVNIHHRPNNHTTEVKIQIVLRLFDSPAEVLVGFDVDCCCCAYDGKDVWVTKRCISALKTGINTLNPLHAWPNKPSYEMRLAKYAYRGFPVHVPGLDKRRIDWDQITQSKFSKLKGLARMIKVAVAMDSSYFREMPEDIDELKRNGVEEICRSGDELLVAGKGEYDELGHSVIVPRVYGVGPDWIPNDDREPIGYMWWDYSYTFPLSAETRDAAWEEILDCGDLAPDVPGRLLDSWDAEKRSREYLNAEMDSFDLDNLYYCQAYKD